MGEPRSKLKTFFGFLLGNVLLLVVIGVATDYISFSFIGAPKQVAVPDVTNMESIEAEKILYSSGLRATIRNIPSPPLGTVIEQSPSPGTSMVEKDSVLLVVGSGGSSEPALRPESGQGSGLAKAILPSGTALKVELLSDISVDDALPPSLYQGRLVEPVRRGKVVVAHRGAPVTLSVSSALGAVSNTLQLSVRNVTQADGRTLPVSTTSVDYTSEVTWGTIVGSAVLAVIACLAIGFVLSFVLMMMFIPLSPDAGAGCGFILGVIIAATIISSAIRDAKSVQLKAGTNLVFELTDASIVN